MVWNRRKRFAWILTALLVGGFLVTSMISYQVARHSLSREITENTLPLTSDNVYSEIQRDLLRPVFISSLMAQDTFLRDWMLSGEQNPDSLIKYLSEIQQRYATVTSFFVSERTRQYYHASGILKRVAADDPADRWYFRVRRLPKQQEYEVNIDADTADRTSTTVFVNYKVLDYQGNLIGVTGVGLSVNSVKRLIESYRQRYGREIFFVDRQGQVTLHGDQFSGPLNIRQRPGLSDWATQILTSPSGSFQYASQGMEVFVNSRLVPEFDWYLMVEQRNDPMHSDVTGSLVINILVSLLVTLAVLALASITIGGYQRKLEEMATYDKLTGALNRQAFDVLFEQSLQLTRRKKTDLALLMVDLDHFKAVNDQHGHLVGDQVLKATVATIRGLIRNTDLLCRWGGEEFSVLLMECDLRQALEIAEKIRHVIADNPVPTAAGRIAATCSVGVGQLGAAEHPGGFLSRVDQALYRAKQVGRNRVEQA